MQQLFAYKKLIRNTQKLYIDIMIQIFRLSRVMQILGTSYVASAMIVIAGLIPNFGWTAEAFPGYDVLCGFPLLVAPTPKVAQATLNHADRPIIVLDPVLETVDEKHRRLFLIAHECAHHRLGHVTASMRRKRARSYRVVRDQELSADCWAAETLAQAGLEQSVRIMAIKFSRAGPYSPGEGYPSGLQRSAIIRMCAHIGHQARHTHASDPVTTK